MKTKKFKITLGTKIGNMEIIGQFTGSHDGGPKKTIMT